MASLKIYDGSGWQIVGGYDSVSAVNWNNSYENVYSGVTDGQVLGSNGTAPTWVNRYAGRLEYSDFFNNASGYHGPWQYTTIAGGASVLNLNSTARYVDTNGAIQLRSTTVSGSGFSVDVGTERLVAKDNLFYQCIWAMSDDFTNKDTRLGFYDQRLDVSALVTDGLYFGLANSDLVKAYAVNNGSLTTAAGDYTMSADTVYIFTISMEGSGTARYTIHSNDGATEYLNTTVSSNIPNTQARRFSAGIISASRDNVQDDLLVLDYMALGYRPNRPFSENRVQGDRAGL
jgi:hypothetical protein